MIIKGEHNGKNKGLKLIQRESQEAESVPMPNVSFRYLTVDSESPDPNAFLPDSDPDTMIAALRELGSAMVDDSVPDGQDNPNGNSKIPTIYTYWGQFIDHDITAGTDRLSNGGSNMLGGDIFQTSFTPQDPKLVEQRIVNLRLPYLDLDSVYGDGPRGFGAQQEDLYESDEVRLKVGTNSIVGQPTPNPELDDDPAAPRRDLPRHPRDNNKVLARVGDERNDENTIVAQLHTAFIRFHNAVADQLEANGTPGNKLFEEARKMVTWTYQWLVVNDYLPTICSAKQVREIWYGDNAFFGGKKEFMPLEFSVAAFRFGHSMVRAEYDFNMNFNQQGPNRATFDQLFLFTGSRGMSGLPSLPNNWIIDWDRFTNPHDGNPERFARMIDTNIALPLDNLPTDGPPMPNNLEKMLAARNLLRGYLLSIPTAQWACGQLGITPLAPDEIRPADKPAVSAILDANGFLDKTPLWYYILREAEAECQGASLGTLGTQIVAGTMIGMIKNDSESFYHHNWNPGAESALRLPDGRPIVGIRDLLEFAGVS